jgi:hypothetical protein
MVLVQGEAVLQEGCYEKNEVADPATPIMTDLGRVYGMVRILSLVGKKPLTVRR